MGKRAENYALNYLKQQGLKLLEKNFYCRHGEIDLILKDQDTLVFVEVRYRKNNHYGHAFETINKRKQHKIITTARYYLHKHKLTESICSRFDIISIEKDLNSQNAHPENSQVQKNDKHTADKHLLWFKNAFSYE